MAKRVNILYFGNRGGEYNYVLCEHKIHHPLDEDHRFKTREQLFGFMSNGFSSNRRRTLEVALDKEIPSEDKQLIIEFVKENFPKAEFINY